MIGVYVVREIFLVVLHCVIIKFAVIGISSINEGAKTGIGITINSSLSIKLQSNSSIRKMHIVFFIPPEILVDSSPPRPYSTH
jgi:hypothetical protein